MINNARYRKCFAQFRLSIGVVLLLKWSKIKPQH